MFRKVLRKARCVDKALEKCTGPLPKLYLMEEEDLANALDKVGCTGNEVKEVRGCSKGCDYRKAQACFSVFSETVDQFLWGKVNHQTCG